MVYGPQPEGQRLEADQQRLTATVGFGLLTCYQLLCVVFMVWKFMDALWQQLQGRRW